MGKKKNLTEAKLEHLHFIDLPLFLVSISSSACNDHF